MKIVIANFYKLLQEETLLLSLTQFLVDKVLTKCLSHSFYGTDRTMSVSDAPMKILLNVCTCTLSKLSSYDV